MPSMDPCLVMVALSTTVPVMCASCANLGYTGGVLWMIMPDATPAEMATTCGMTLAFDADPKTEPGTELLSSSETVEGAVGGGSSAGAVDLIWPAMRVGAT